MVSNSEDHRMNLQCHEDLMFHTIPSNLVGHNPVGLSILDVGKGKKKTYICKIKALNPVLAFI
jgi:hypothetical protein